MGKNRKLNLICILGFPLTALAFMSGCVPEGATTGEEGSIWPIVIFLALIFGMFYLLMIRPQRKKQKEHQEMTQALQKGDKVITAGGIFGQVESLNEESAVLKIESGVTLRISRSSIIGIRDK
ncbi:preprotein translocase subunit YajC [Chloroflexota bacterium]